MPLPNPGMSFTPLDPLPASDLNDIVENVEALADGSGLDDGAVTAPKLDADAIGHGFLEIGRTTLGTAGDTISVTGLPACTYLKVLFSASGTGGTVGAFMRFNNDAGNNYADVIHAPNGGADVPTTSSNAISITGATTYHLLFFDAIIVNIQSLEKLATTNRSTIGSTGAANAPGRVGITGKWANTANQINRIDIVNIGGTGDYAVGSEVIVFGKN